MRTVDLVVHDKEDWVEQGPGRIAMQKGESGTWTGSLTPKSGLGLSDYRGYLLHEITWRQKGSGADPMRLVVAKQ